MKKIMEKRFYWNIYNRWFKNKRVYIFSNVKGFCYD